MSRLERVDWLDPRAVALRADMDAESGALYLRVMARMSKADRDRFATILPVDPADVVVTLIAFDDDGTPVGHAGLKRLHGDLSDALEVKKVFVQPSHRGRGLSRLLMSELEVDARATGAARLVLQTGDQQITAIALYGAIGYQPIAPFGGYEIFPPTLCYAKTLD
jgi:GNAT superfamily N-acetyltransferase